MAVKFVHSAHISAKDCSGCVGRRLCGEKAGEEKMLVWCENIAEVSMINHGSSSNRDVMHLACCLAFIKAKLEFELFATPFPGVHNPIADALSHNHMDLFHSLLPQADAIPTAIPEALLDLLIVSRPDWTSRHWTELWSTIFRMV